MSPSTSTLGHIWDEASTPDAERLARQFESDWNAGRRADPLKYLGPDSPPGARLALLRTEMALRWESGDSITAERYLERCPDLGDETLVALIYEEFCLREEAGQPVSAADFYRRFPEVAERLQRVLGIHGLVGTGRTTTFPLGPSSPSSPAFPEAGQTIGGFHLVEELGRGSFARVFRAEERQLADRPVALKVARTGSREPQTLARLQHTHIVPVYSYRTDPATDLHLLCMPYLGGVTLARLLSDRQVKSARSGSDLLAALDRIEPPAAGAAAGDTSGRTAIARRSHVRAIAWWGARLAEALAHAHERGVLHRDIKPSNVLVTSDGLPLLLDFNLAWETRIDDPEIEAAALGGTLAYMAPEHLDAHLANAGHTVDARCDIYSLGVVLFEAMGARPFAPIKGATSVVEVLRRTAQQRRDGPPSLRDRFPNIPAEFSAVVDRCLAPDPAQRYVSASALAADLQAVADDQPLRHAREPVVNRTVRWTRRNRLRLAVAAPLLLIAALAGLAFVHHSRSQEQGREEFRQLLYKGMVLAGQGDLEMALAQFELADKLSEGPGAAPPEQGPPDDQKMRLLVRNASTWDDLRGIARERKWHVSEELRARRAADGLHASAEGLRLRLLGFVGPAGDPSIDVAKALKPFYVMTAPSWPLDDQAALLDDLRLAHLREDVEDLLFLWALYLDDRIDGEPSETCISLANAALSLCERAVMFAPVAGPWRALEARIVARRDGRNPPAVAVGGDWPGEEKSDRACFYWGVLRAREGRNRAAVAWLERATRLKQSDYWYHYLLALKYQELANSEGEALAHDSQQALAHYNVAIALREEWPWPRFNRARLYQESGHWTRAQEDLEAALRLAEPEDRPPIWLNLGMVRQSLGNLPAACAAYEEIIAATAPDEPLARAARLNRARLDAEIGATARALAEYSALLETDRNDNAARYGRALIELRSGQASAAESDLDTLLSEANAPERADWFAGRAAARLALGRPVEADRDAAAAQQREPSPAHDRLRLRTLLASGRVESLHLSDPEALRRLSVLSPEPRAALRAAAKALAGRDGLQPLLDRAVISAVLGDVHAARDSANRAVELFNASARPFLVRARVLHAAGDRAGALADIEHGLQREPEDPRLIALRGRLRTEMGDPEAGLADSEFALVHGGEWTASIARAEALHALGRNHAALEAWSQAIRSDPEDARLFLGRARTSIRLAHWDLALADLEQAAGWSGDHPALLVPILATYIECLPVRPNRLPRVLHLGRRTLAALIPRP